MSREYFYNHHEIEKIPPHSLEAEQAVLGGLMLSSAAMDQVADLLRPEDFYSRNHRAIFRAMIEIHPDSMLDPVTLSDEIPDVDDIGGLGYLIELASTTPSAANVMAYAEIVKEKARLRQLIEAGTELINKAFDQEGSRELAATSLSTLSAIADAAGRTGPRNMLEIGREWFRELSLRHENGGKLTGLLTPWAKLNTMTGAFQPGQLVILAGRPGMGKSAVAINLMLSTIMSGKSAMMFNLEMSAVSIYNRMVSALQEVPLNWIKAPGEDGEDYWPRVTMAVKELSNKALLIDETAGLSLQQIMSRARREHSRRPLDLLVIDHLSLIPLPGKTRETVEIGNITAALKKLAKDLGIPVLLLAQLNRGVESRSSKRPVMSDLRESGNIEQDADIILLLYRDDYYANQECRASEHPGLVEMILAKQRDGITGTAWGRFRGDIGRVDDVEEEPERREFKPQPKQRGYSGKSRAANDLE